MSIALYHLRIKFKMAGTIDNPRIPPFLESEILAKTFSPRWSIQRQTHVSTIGLAFPAVVRTISGKYLFRNDSL